MVNITRITENRGQEFEQLIPGLFAQASSGNVLPITVAPRVSLSAEAAIKHWNIINCER